MPDRKSRWANPLWYFLHGFAEKIDEDYYNKNYLKFFNFFKELASNIPCPYCRNEAVNRLNKVNPHIICNTKQKLILFWFNFHNDVNKKLGKKIYNKNYLELYKRINMRKCIILVHNTFFKTLYNFKIFNGWIRNEFKKKWVKFIRSHHKLLGIN